MRWKACGAQGAYVAFEDGAWWKLPDDVGESDEYDVEAAEHGWPN